MLCAPPARPSGPAFQAFARPPFLDGGGFPAVSWPARSVKSTAVTHVSETIRTDTSGAIAVADPLAVRANKLELLERLADALAHEIKNPLHSMVINLEVLKRKLGRLPGGDEVLRYTTVLGEELDRVSRRVELLLRLSRPDRGSEEITLTELVEEVMELVQLEARHREARVEYNTEGAMARVRVGRQPARQIILNLVLDALEALPSGETLHVTVRGEDGRSTLTIQASTAPGATQGARTGVASLLAESVGGQVWAQDGKRTFVLPSGRA